MDRSLSSIELYSQAIYRFLDDISIMHRYTMNIYPCGASLGILEGTIEFDRELTLRIRERLDFAREKILVYSYEIWRGQEQLVWYDPQEHPDDASLTISFPHHKHIPPDIKHHRTPAPELSFTRPNLPVLIEEIKKLIKG